MPNSLVDELERFRVQLVELEALAHSAEAALQDIPYHPGVDDDEDRYSDMSLGMGRLQTLVATTASRARDALAGCDRLMETRGATSLADSANSAECLSPGELRT